MNFNHIQKLHGGYWRYHFLDFCYLYNCYFPTKAFYNYLTANLPKLIGNYSSAHKDICLLLSKWDKSLKPSNIIIGNGASELIRIFNKHIVKKITIPGPTFNEYENGISKENINYIALDPKNNFNINKDDFVRSVRISKSNVALIINPNNPTGSLTPRSDIIYILEQLPDTLILVDESFIAFTGTQDSVQDLVYKYNNLVIIKSLSKEYGIPGIRIGYILTTNSFVRETLLEHLPIWNINSIAEYFIEWFPKYKVEYDKSILKTIQNRNIFYKDLNKIPGFEVVPSYANFFLCKTKSSADIIQQKLFKKYNIYVKNCSNKRFLEDSNYLRISVRTLKENRILVHALKSILVNK